VPGRERRQPVAQAAATAGISWALRR
jgi:hypothetical protein